MNDAYLYLTDNYKNLEFEYHHTLHDILEKGETEIFNVSDNQINIINVFSSSLYNSIAFGPHALLLYKVENDYAYLIDSNLKSKAIKIKREDLEKMLAHEYISIKIKQ